MQTFLPVAAVREEGSKTLDPVRVHLKRGLSTENEQAFLGDEVEAPVGGRIVDERLFGRKGEKERERERERSLPNSSVSTARVDT